MSKLMRLNVFGPALAVVVLSGCATTAANCDPSNKDAGTFTKLSCATGGGYREHITQRENELRTAQAENALAKQVLADLEAQRAAVGKSLQEKTKARDALAASTKKMLEQARVKAQNNPALQQQLSQSEKVLSTPINVNASDAATYAQLKKMRAEVEKLEKLSPNL